MNDFVAANLPLVIIGALLALAVLWWLLMANRRTRVEVDRRDTLDEGAAPAARNQALIDAPSAAASNPAPIPPAVPGAIAGAEVAVAAVAEEAQVAREAAGGDDLTRIKGLGPTLAATLADLGVTRFDQIAGWSDADIDRIDAQLGRFEGRIRRDSWVEQAGLLASGNDAEFQSRFGSQ